MSWNIPLRGIESKENRDHLDTYALCVHILWENRRIKTLKLGRLRFWQTRTDVDVLRGMLRGEFISRTKKVGRGRGISGVHRDFSAGRIENAVIVSNKVYANLRADRFQSLGRELRGTLIQWEIAR